MSFGVIGLVGNVVVSSTSSSLDAAVIDKVNQLALQVAEVQEQVENVQGQIDNIEKGHIDWEDA